MRAGALALLLGTGIASALAGQTDVRARLNGRVAPAVVLKVQQLVDSAAAERLPAEPLVDKALEGAAKNASSEQVITAVRAVANRLRDAAAAIRASGPGVIAVPESGGVAAGAFALSAGLRRNDLEALAHATRAPFGLAATFRVAGTLAALGVPGDEAVSLVLQALNHGRSPGDLLDLPRRVQMGTAQGASPAQSAAGIAQPGGHGESGEQHGQPPTPGHAHKP